MRTLADVETLPRSLDLGLYRKALVKVLERERAKGVGYAGPGVGTSERSPDKKDSQSSKSRVSEKNLIVSRWCKLIFVHRRPDHKFGGDD